MRPDIFFNCQPGGLEPDWQRFTNLELGGCIDLAEDGSYGTWIEGGRSRQEAEFFTIYGRLQEGGAEAITDCLDFESARRVTAYLVKRSGLTLEILC